MEVETVFECGNDKCAYAIASNGLNELQLKALRRWKKTCPRCGKQTHWAEKIPLLNTETLAQANGGSGYAKNIQEATREDRNRKRRAQRRTDRGAGLH